VISVSSVDQTVPGQQLGYAPQRLDFGQIDLGTTSHKTVRISNFGFSDLTVSDIRCTLPDFTSFFTSPFTVPPYGFTELVVEFSPARVGLFSADLVIESDDPRNTDSDGDQHGEVWIPLLGGSNLNVAVTPLRLDFGQVASESEKSMQIWITNRGETMLTLTNLESSSHRFAPQASFATLGSSETGSIEVRFRPGQEGQLRGILTLGFDAPAEKTVVLSMQGAGVQGLKQ
jgi:hypothetical protein